MKAIVQNAYGSSAVLTLADMAMPSAALAYAEQGHIRGKVVISVP